MTNSEAGGHVAKIKARADVLANEVHLLNFESAANSQPVAERAERIAEEAKRLMHLAAEFAGKLRGEEAA